MRKLSGTTGTADIKCPFFIAHGTNEIVCESVIPGARQNITRYAGPEEKRFQQKTYCECNYKRCEMYISIMHWKWPEDGEPENG